MNADGGVTARVYNASDEVQTGTLKIGTDTYALELKAYEFKTYVGKDGKLEEK